MITDQAGLRSKTESRAAHTFPMISSNFLLLLADIYGTFIKGINWLQRTWISDDLALLTVNGKLILLNFYQRFSMDRNQVDFIVKKYSMSQLLRGNGHVYCMKTSLLSQVLGWDFKFQTICSQSISVSWKLTPALETFSLHFFPFSQIKIINCSKLYL